MIIHCNFCFIIIIMGVYVCVSCLHVCINHNYCVEVSGFSSPLCGSDQTQIHRLGSKCLYLLSHLAGSFVLKRIIYLLILCWNISLCILSKHCIHELYILFDWNTFVLYINTFYCDYNYRITHVDMDKKSILWNLLKQKAESLQISLECGNL